MVSSRDEQSNPKTSNRSEAAYLLSGAGAGFGASGAGAGFASGAGTGAGATGVAAGFGASAAAAGFASGAFGASAFFSAAGASAFFSAGAGAPPSQAANEMATADAARTEVIWTFMIGDSGLGLRCVSFDLLRCKYRFLNQPDISDFLGHD
jgi:hypothetical protein